MNSDNFDVKYLLPGYFYAVISIVSKEGKAEYSSDIVLFTTNLTPIISVSNKYEYFKIGGPYKKTINFYIPQLSEDTILNLNYKSTSNSQKRIYIDKYTIRVVSRITTDFNTTDYNIYYKLEKGFGYFIYIKDRYNSSYTYEVLFQFPSSEIMKLEDGKPIYTSTLIDYFYYFYYDCSQMKKGDELFIKISNKSISSYLYYVRLNYNDYNYIYDKRNSNFEASYNHDIIKKGNISSTF